MSTAGINPGVVARAWQRYLVALREHPMRTRMITSGVLYVVGDGVAQFGIEGRCLDLAQTETDEKQRWDPMRTARLTFYGSMIFAPLGHLWLSRLETFKAGGRMKTMMVRVACDLTLWSPFVAAMFPTSLGILEGKTIEQIKQKVSYSWFPTWLKALCVFGPTQVVNFSLVPAQHRMLVLQSVGLCWNIFLSWSNNLNNRRLAEAAAALSHTRVLAQQHGDLGEEEIRRAEAKVEAAKAKVEATRAEGSAEKVGTRMGWA